MSLYLGDQQIAGISTPVQGRVLGQIIHSLIPLNDAGLHLADGSLIDGTGTYKDFYDYMENLYNNTSTTTSNVYLLNCYSRNKITLSNDFIASNFTSSRYLKVPNGRNNASEFVIKFKTSSDITTYQKIQHCEFFCCIELRSSVISTWDWQNGQNRTILSSINADTDYWIKVIINGTTKTFYTSTDGINYTQSLSYSDTGMDYSSTYDFVLGVSSLDQLDQFLGTIDLKEFYVKQTVNNYYICKFVIPSKGSFIDQQDYDYLYNTYGACGKFVIDITNKTIRLPYINNIIQSTLNNEDIGKLIEPGLPNITGSSLLYGGSDTSNRGVVYDTDGAFYTTNTSTVHYASTGSTKSVDNSSFRMNASLSNGIYSNSDTVQPQTVKAYIYIVIATLTKTNIEVDIDEIATDLNGKADKDLVNVSPSDVRNALDNANVRYIIGTYRNGFSWHNIYSDGWVEQGGRFKTNSSTGYKDINLLVEMADTNFSIYAIRGAQSTTSNYDVWVQNPDYTASTTMIRIYISNTSAYVYWKVAGQSKTS